MQPSLNDTTQMEEPQEKPNFFAETKSLFQSYLGDRFTLVKLQAIEKVSVIAAVIVSGILIFILGLFFLIALTVMLGFLFGHLLHSVWLGFGIVAGIYVIIDVDCNILRQKAFR